MRKRAALFLLLSLPLSLSGCAATAQPGWALHATQLDAVRGRADGLSVRVALLDTGLDPSLPALAHLTDHDLFDGELVAYQDFLGGGSRPRDDDGHGSYVAGILAGRPPSGLAGLLHPAQGVQGLAPSVQLAVGRLCDGQGRCSLYGLRTALEWAMAQDADVVGLSLGFTADEVAGSPEYVREVRATLARMAARGILVVAAAGNDGAGGVLFPADDPSVVAVGAVGPDLRPRASTAFGRGGKPDLAAPGESIVGPARGGLESAGGTSAAVPFVVATAALLIQAGADPADGAGLARLRAALESTAQPLHGQVLPRDPQAGLGLVRAADAWQAYVG